MTGLAGLLPALAQVRTEYGPPHRQTRARLLERASACAIDDGRVLRAYHDLLLFVAAFPDNAEILTLARRELRRAAVAARELTRRARRRDLAVLEDSGIAHSVSTVQLSVAASNWIATRFPAHTEIAWHEGSAGTGLDAMLGAVVEPVEADGCADVRLNTEDWFRAARGGRPRAKSDLCWLLEHFARLELDPRVHDEVFDLLDLRIRWHLESTIASRTFSRIGHCRTHFQTEPLARSAAAIDIVAMRPPPTRPLSRAAACDLIDRARAALAVRHRETDPITFADPADVTLFTLGHGIEVVLFGLRPEFRLPLDTYYGFVLAKNRVPMAYGGAWMFFARCEIGVNVFEAYRGGESARAFAGLMRVYRWHLDDVVAAGAEGIGLYRTEFEVLAHGALLDEASQTRLYTDVVERALGAPVSIRLFDLGNDKRVLGVGVAAERNPALGLRGARLPLAHPEILRPQARAIARASLSGPVDVIYPMIVDDEQFRQLRTAFERAIAGLRRGAVRHGVMFEVPAACVQSDTLLAAADFACIGTSDPTQYLFAIDRDHLGEAFDAALGGEIFWTLLDGLVRSARSARKRLSACGVVAADPLRIPALKRAGIRTVSVEPRRIADIRRAAA